MMGINYFTYWGCKSSTGLDTIKRLNILPLGTHAAAFQKDSLFYPQSRDGLYFTASRYANSNSSTYSLKKAVFDQISTTWKIYDVLDYRTNALGVSSQDGIAPDYIVNDYSLPGIQPSAVLPGSQSKIPGVSDISSNGELGLYPLIGSGPMGVTAIAEFLQGPGVGSTGITGRTCLLFNPKLFNYDANQVPHSMLVSLFRRGNTAIGEASSMPCALPTGAPLTILPAAGAYIFDYDTNLGWQLNPTLVTTNGTMTGNTSSMKPTWSNPHAFLQGDFSGHVTAVDTEQPSPSNRTTILDCSNIPAGKGFLRAPYFGEPSGDINRFIVLSHYPQQPAFTDSTNVALVADIFYVYSSANSGQSSP